MELADGTYGRLYGHDDLHILVRDSKDSWRDDIFEAAMAKNKLLSSFLTTVPATRCMRQMPLEQAI